MRCEWEATYRDHDGSLAVAECPNQHAHVVDVSHTHATTEPVEWYLCDPHFHQAMEENRSIMERTSRCGVCDAFVFHGMVQHREGCAYMQWSLRQSEADQKADDEAELMNTVLDNVLATLAIVLFVFAMVVSALLALR